MCDNQSSRQALNGYRHLRPANIALQPTPRCGDEIGPILTADLPSAASRSMIGGAAERRRWAGTRGLYAEKPA